MRTTICRTIIICVVWMSTGMFLTFGLPNYKVDSSDQVLFDVFSVVVGVGGALVTTIIIWLGGRRRAAVGHAFEVVRPATMVEDAA